MTNSDKTAGVPGEAQVDGQPEAIEDAQLDDAAGGFSFTFGAKKATAKIPGGDQFSVDAEVALLRKRPGRLKISEVDMKMLRKTSGGFPE